MNWLLIFILFAALSVVPAMDVLELHGSSLELELTTHKYIAVLFYDDSDLSKAYHHTWVRAANEIDDFPADCEIAKASSSDPEMFELMQSYQIELPSIGVFRRGMMNEYRGPLDVKGIARFLKEDAKPSVQHVTTLKEMRQILSENTNTVLFGIFNNEELQEQDPEDGYSISAWGQFQASADALRWHVPFYAATSEEVLNNLELTEKDLPVVFMATTEHDGVFLRYEGEIFEIILSEWVLANTAPPMGELTVSTSSGVLYTTQFFASQRLKFVLYVPAELMNDEILKAWEEVASVFSNKAIFAYLTRPEVEFQAHFELNAESKLPQIVAQQPTHQTAQQIADARARAAAQSGSPTMASLDYQTVEAKYNSGPLDSLDSAALMKFVAGVITGTVPKIIKSEPIPSPKDASTTSSLVVTAVGSNVRDIVSTPGKDVLLLIYQPWCEQCSKLIPAFDVLGRAVQSEKRIMLAKINIDLNDIPESWGVVTYPALLWFRSSDKAALSGAPGMVSPRPYWDAGYSLTELLGFVHRHSSFDVATLRVASSEQLHFTLLEDEVAVRAKYLEEETKFMRNKGRYVYSSPLLDYLMGEVVFDGCRFHQIIMFALGSLVISMALYIYYLTSSSSVAKILKKKTN